MISFRLPGLSNLFSKPSPSPPPVILPPPLPPTPAVVDNSAEEKARKEEERKSRLRRSGLGATRLTSPNLGDDETSVQRSSLGGA